MSSISAELNGAVLAVESVSDLGTSMAKFEGFTAAGERFRYDLVELLANHSDAFVSAFVAQAAEPSFGQLHD